MKIGDKVQVWNEATHQCLGWGTIIQIAVSAKDHEEIPLIQLESGKRIWGGRRAWITEEVAVKAGIRIWRAINKNNA